MLTRRNGGGGGDRQRMLMRRNGGGGGGVASRGSPTWSKSNIYITYLSSVVEYIFPASKDHAGVWFLRYRLFTSPWRVFGVEH
jgi:hypothetical protein